MATRFAEDDVIIMTMEMAELLEQHSVIILLCFVHMGKLKGKRKV